MQYRNIAKRFIWTHGFRTPMIAEDGVQFGEAKKTFTAGQLDKANAARVGVADSMMKKWADIVPKAERKDLPARVADADVE